MLTRSARPVRRTAHRVRTAAAALALALATLVVPGTPAAARAPGAECPPGQPHCDVWTDLPGDPGGDGGPTNPGGGDGGGGDRICRRDSGERVPCYDELRGWFNSADDCYYKRAEPQPDGIEPGKTAYLRTCIEPATSELVFLTDPPPGFEPPDPAQVAAQLLARLPLERPRIRTAPDGRPGLVGVPVWLADTSSWDRLTSSAEQGGITVSIEAIPTRIVWDMGNGATVTCESAGIPFRADRHDPRHPPADACSYPGYPATSHDRTDDVYRITATKHWLVPWNGGGERGELTASLSATATIQIDELQVVTR